jgi:hypothetical protein
VSTLTDGLTFEAWIKPGTTVQAEVLAVLGSLGWGVMLMCTDTSQEGCCAGHVVNSVGFYSQKNSNACADMPSSTAAVPRGAWSHVAVTVAPLAGGGKTVSFFIDGAAAGTKSDAAYAIGNGGGVKNLTLGGAVCADGTSLCSTYIGFMDNVRIWHAVLTQQALDANKNRHIHSADPYASYLVAYYSFDNGFTDDHKGAHNGSGIPTAFFANDANVDAFFSNYNEQVLGAAVVPLAAAVVPAAAYFNGVSVFSTPYAAALAALPDNALTFEAWIKPGTAVKGEFLAALGAVPAGWAVMLMCNGAVVGSKCCSGTSHVQNSIGFFAGTSSCQDVPSSTAAVTRGVWSHVAVTVAAPAAGGSGKTVSFFINGVPAGSNTNAAYAIGNGGGVKPFTLGGALCSTAPCAAYTGYMDNVRLWNAALHPEAIELNNNRHVHPAFPLFAAGKLIANYTFDGNGLDGHNGAHNLVPPVQFNVPFSAAENQVLLDAKVITSDPSGILFGATTKVYVPYSPKLVPVATGLTFEAWIKPTVYANLATGVHGGFLAAMGYRGWAVTLMCTTAGAMGCCSGGGHVEGSIGFWASNATDYTCQKQPSSTVGVARGVWSHVAVTAAPPFYKMNPRSAGWRVCFYINGAAAGCKDESGGNLAAGVDPTPPLVFGGFNSSTCGATASTDCVAGSYYGYMDDVRIWNTPLDAFEIARFKSAALSPAHPHYASLVANYTFTPDRNFLPKRDNIVDDHGHALNGTISDISGFNADNDVTVSKAGPAPAAASLSGPSAFYFNGFDQYVTVPYSAALAPSDYLTVELWVKPTGGGEVRTEPLVALGNLGWSVQLMCGGSGNMCCGNHVNRSIGLLSQASSANTTCANAPSSTAAVAVDVWNHIAVTVDNVLKNVTFYINGAYAGHVISTAVGLYNGGGGNLGIGAWLACSGCSLYMGYMDELRIFNALVAREHINGFKGSAVPDWHPDRAKLLVYYRFDSAAGKAALDLSGNGRNGVVASNDRDVLVWKPLEKQASAPVPPAPPPNPPPLPPQEGPTSLYFNGVNTYVNVSRTPSMAAWSGAESTILNVVNSVPVWTRGRELTFEAWIKPDTDVRAQALVMLGISGWGVTLMCNPSAGAGRGCCGTHLTNSIAFWNTANYWDAAACAGVPSSTGVVTRGVWNHIAVTVKAGTVKFYVGGVPAGSYTNATTVIVNDGGGGGDLYFGVLGSLCSTCLPYKGWMDEVKIFTAEVPAADITFFKDVALPPWHPEYDRLVAYYKFDFARGFVAVAEGSGAPAANGFIHSSSANDVTWDNDTLVTATVTPSPPPNPPPLAPQAGPASMYFNGVNTKLTVKFDHELLPNYPNVMTFDAWIKPDEAVSSQMLAMLGEWGWGVALMCPSGAGVGCCGSHVLNSIAFWSTNSTSDAVCAAQLSSTVGVTRGQWNHISVTVNAKHHSNDVRFYVNGDPAGYSRSHLLGSINNGTNATKNDLVFGSAPCAWPEWTFANGVFTMAERCLAYKGLMDEVTIVNAEWSAAEVAAWRNRHFEAWMPGYEKVILGFKFDKGFGYTVVNAFNLAGQPGAKFDATVNTTDANAVVWNIADKVTLTSFEHPPPPSPPPSSPPPRVGPSSLYFNGVDITALQRMHSSILFDARITFEAWIKPESVTAYQHIAEMGWGGSGSGSGSSAKKTGWAVGLMCGAGHGPTCCGDHVNGAVGWIADNKGSSTACLVAKSSTVGLKPNVWQHIAVAVDAYDTAGNIRYVKRTAAFYIDGVNVGTFTTADASGNSPIQIPLPTQVDTHDGIYIGHGSCSTSDMYAVQSGAVRGRAPCKHYKGLIDEVKLWKAALEASTIKTHYDKDVISWHADRADLVFHYKFDQGRGLTVPATIKANAALPDIVLKLGLSANSPDEAMVWNNTDHKVVLGTSSIGAPPLPNPPPPSPPPQLGPAALWFNGRDTQVVAPFGTGAMAPENALTFQAWILPQELHRGQVLAMMGDNGWAVMLACNEGNGTACCGSHLPAGLYKAESSLTHSLKSPGLDP